MQSNEKGDSFVFGEGFFKFNFNYFSKNYLGI